MVKMLKFYQKYLKPVLMTFFEEDAKSIAYSEIDKHTLEIEKNPENNFKCPKCSKDFTLKFRFDKKRFYLQKCSFQLVISCRTENCKYEYFVSPEFESDKTLELEVLKKLLNDKLFEPFFKLIK